MKKSVFELISSQLEVELIRRALYFFESLILKI